MKSYENPMLRNETRCEFSKLECSKVLIWSIYLYKVFELNIEVLEKSIFYMCVFVHMYNDGNDVWRWKIRQLPLWIEDYRSIIIRH